MSISQKEISFVGKLFKSNQEVLNYLVQTHIILKEEAQLYIERIENNEGSLDKLFKTKISNFPHIEKVNISSVQAIFLGYRVVTNLIKEITVEEFHEDIKKAQNLWKEIFGDIGKLEILTQQI